MTSVRSIITVLCQAGPNQSYDEFTKFVEDTATKKLEPLGIPLITSALFLHNEWTFVPKVPTKFELSSAFHAQANGCQIFNPNLAKLNKDFWEQDNWYVLLQVAFSAIYNKSYNSSIMQVTPFEAHFCRPSVLQTP